MSETSATSEPLLFRFYEATLALTLYAVDCATVPPVYVDPC